MLGDASCSTHRFCPKLLLGESGGGRLPGSPGLASLPSSSAWRRALSLPQLSHGHDPEAQPSHAKARVPREGSGHCSPWAVGEGTFLPPQAGQSGSWVGRRRISQGWDQGWGFLEGQGPAEQPFLCWRKTPVAHYKAGFGVGPGPGISPSLGWNPQFDEPPEKDPRSQQLPDLPLSEISHSLDPWRPPAAWSIQAGRDRSWRRLPLADSEPGRADRVGWG